MAILGLWAGTTSSPSGWTVASNLLPSPISVDVTREQIWNASAGRSENTGEMVATYVTAKKTYAIKWGVLTGTEFSKLNDLLTTTESGISSDDKGWFYFGEGGITNSEKPTSVIRCYRSEISYSIIMSGTARYYKDVSVSVIQQ